ncbi:hypothetical protein TSUD_369600 [Trifolium subterraneum]|uniref:Uncharacterized protein n=1 Tax=Trifolium subterraneum TaxID=3900 RepID=A0A2Z6P8E6_TRISU|nr:hypothetical protein TSUD_369600 [Trifolium subterraneum]
MCAREVLKSRCCSTDQFSSGRRALSSSPVRQPRWVGGEPSRVPEIGGKHGDRTIKLRTDFNGMLDSAIGNNRGWATRHVMGFRVVSDGWVLAVGF